MAAAFERARALGAVESPAWPHALHGSWWVHFVRGELPAARSHAEAMLALAERRGDPALRLTGLNATGMTLMMMGELAGARTNLEAALDTHAALDAALPPTRFVQDPEVEACLSLALVTWLAGEPRRARSLAERAVAVAVANRHPLSEVSGLYGAAMLHALAGEFDTVHQLTERLYGVIRDQEVPQERSGFAWLHGRALVALGRVEEGMEEMRAAKRTALELGFRFSLGDFHFHYAEACREGGQHAQADASIDAGLALARDSGEKLMLSAMLRLQAQMQAERGDLAAATRTFDRAIETARAQGAIFHELAALATAQRMGCAEADPDRLARLLAHYDGDASPVIVAARALVHR